jgi:hypothetical protein
VLDAFAELAEAATTAPDIEQAAPEKAGPPKRPPIGTS